uniref:Retrotransposable element Tf2 n=1 Tax=Cajanus cajan TaxID=3821 RepID=A0A151RIJ5_CAJCA|nr:Retrotransposable element Tf2 [Cajanus cajan]
MKKYADQKRMHKEFQVGDLVLVKLQPYRQHSLALRKNQKLGLRYFGPFPIQERIGSVAYKLLLPDYAKLHPVFHISQLKQFRGVTDVVYVPLPLTTSVEGPVVLPFKILSIRDIIRAGQTVHQILVQWEGFSEDEATWEDSEEMAKSYPNLNLEDKVIHKGGSIVTEREITSGLGRKEVDIMDDQGQKDKEVIEQSSEGRAEWKEKSRNEEHVNSVSSQGQVAANDGLGSEIKAKRVSRPSVRMRDFVWQRN